MHSQHYKCCCCFFFCFWSIWEGEYPRPLKTLVPPVVFREGRQRAWDLSSCNPSMKYQKQWNRLQSFGLRQGFFESTLWCKQDWYTSNSLLQFDVCWRSNFSIWLFFFFLHIRCIWFVYDKIFRLLLLVILQIDVFNLNHLRLQMLILLPDRLESFAGI